MLRAFAEGALPEVGTFLLQALYLLIVEENGDEEEEHEQVCLFAFGPHLALEQHVDLLGGRGGEELLERCVGCEDHHDVGVGGYVVGDGDLPVLK
jgi:hypothetical protein